LFFVLPLPDRLRRISHAGFTKKAAPVFSTHSPLIHLASAPSDALFQGQAHCQIRNLKRICKSFSVRIFIAACAPTSERSARQFRHHHPLPGNEMYTLRDARRSLKNASVLIHAFGERR
jgi:hypothetical protein